MQTVVSARPGLNLQAKGTKPLRGWIVLLVGLAMLVGQPEPVDAHAQLESSSPPADALIAAPPPVVTLRFTEPIDASGITVTLVDEEGRQVPVGSVAVDPDDSRVVRAESSAIGFGITTVSWTTRSATDGHTLSGSFAFRVGGAGRAPAAATVEGDRPTPWNVATRWLTFLGLALAVGSMVVTSSTRRRSLGTLGAVVALAASLAEPLLLRLAPPEGWAAPSLGEAIRAQPGAWWLRPAAAVVVLVASQLLAQRSSATRVPGPAGLVGLLGLGLTAHAAGRETLRLPALLSVIVHEWSVALWVGGLLLIVLARTPDWTADLQGFSRRVLPIALLAVTTGLINAGFLFPSVERLRAIRETDYGWVLIVKVAVVGIVLALAGLHRLLLRDERRPSPVFRISLPVEAVAVVLVLVAATTLAMLAPPGEAREEGPSRVELALPASPTISDDQMYIRLAVEPEQDERRRLTISATDGPPSATEPRAAGGFEVAAAPQIPDLQLARVTLTSLSAGLAPTTLDLTATGDGSFARDGFVFDVDGWWQADVTVRRPGVEDRTVTFYLLEPNPNIVGFDRVPAVESDPAAAAIQAEARARFEERSSYSYIQALSDGVGAVDVIEVDYSDGGESGDRGVEIRTAELTIVRLDGRRYLRNGDSDWTETGDSPVLSAADVAVDYDGVEQVRMAGEEELNGELCRRITLHVPGTALAPAWYVWWVSVETGELRQEAMVSRAHYMVKRYTAVNEPSVIAAPL